MFNSSNLAVVVAALLICSPTCSAAKPKSTSSSVNTQSRSQEPAAPAWQAPAHSYAAGFKCSQQQARLPKPVNRPPVYRFWQQRFDPQDAYAVQLREAMEGLSKIRTAQMLLGLMTCADEAWQYMAAMHRCCSMVADSLKSPSAYTVFVGPCAQLQDLLGSELALARAYAGPSTIVCSQGFVAMQLRYQRAMGRGAPTVKTWVQELYSGGTLDLPTLLRVYKKFLYPELQGLTFSGLKLSLQLEDFKAKTVLASWLKDGVPIWLEDDLADAGDELSTSWILTVLVLRHSIASEMLREFHNHTTSNPTMHECRNITTWFDEQSKFTPLGKRCQKAGYALSVENTVVDRKMLSQRAASAEAERRVAVAKAVLRDSTPGAPSSVSTERKASLVAASTHNDADDLAAADGFAAECSGWLGCTLGLLLWMWMWVVHVVLPLLVAALCWRPDLLVFWLGWPVPTVHTPSYKSYLKQLKQQRSAAKGARQAASDSVSSLSTPSQSSKKKRGKSSNGTPSAASSGGGVLDTSPNTSTSNISPGSSASFGLGSRVVMTVYASQPSNMHLAYLQHVIKACWLPRARFAAAAVPYLVPFLVTLPARLVVVVLCAPWRVLAAVTQAFA